MIGTKHIGAHQQRRVEPMSEINTTPLVDVMLVLLVIFIITAPLLTHAVKIDLPKASSQLVIEKPEVISISINQSGQIFWDDKPIEKNLVIEKLQDAAQKKKQAGNSSKSGQRYPLSSVGRNYGQRPERRNYQIGVH